MSVSEVRVRRSEIGDRKVATTKPSVGGSDVTVESLARGPQSSVLSPPSLHIALLTGGDDKSYALGLASALVGRRISIDFIGSDKVDAPELHTTPFINFLNLRGDQRENVSFRRKAMRIKRAARTIRRNCPATNLPYSLEQ